MKNREQLFIEKRHRCVSIATDKQHQQTVAAAAAVAAAALAVEEKLSSQ